MGPLSRWREQRLLKRISAGDRAAAEQFVERHYQPTYRWLLQLCGDCEAAADLTQDTFRQVWEGLDGFRGFSSLKTWVHRIAYYTYLRAQRESDPESVPLHNDVRDDSSTNEALMRCGLEAALAQLPMKQRQAVTLHYLQGLTCTEIAEVLEIAAGTVVSRLHAGRQRLRELLRDDASPPKKEVERNVEQIR